MFLLELYLSKLPPYALQNYIFYMKPQSSLPDSPADPWYKEVPVGHNALAKFLKQILKKGGVDTVNKRNHSLQATAISCMYESNFLYRAFWTSFNFWGDGL